MYPGGEPIIFETECFSINSDMSTRNNAFSSSNINSASALVSSVFPTPVGPRKRKEPIGRFGSAIPTRERFTASATFWMASSCPTMRPRSASSIRESFSSSPSSMRVTGTPVQRDTTSAISSSPISSRSTRRELCSFLSRAILIFSSLSSSGI